MPTAFLCSRTEHPENESKKTIPFKIVSKTNTTLGYTFNKRTARFPYWKLQNIVEKNFYDINKWKHIPWTGKLNIANRVITEVDL